jgi:hypothetical protein
MDTMIELPALRRSAELAPNSADTDARTVEVIWSAGARVRRSTLFGEPYDEELSLDPDHVRLDRLNSGAPFLKVHEVDTLDAVIGSVVPGSARIENGRGVAQVRISERADVEPIWRDIRATSVRSPSVTRSIGSRCRNPRLPASFGARWTGRPSRSPPCLLARIRPRASAPNPPFTTASFIAGTSQPLKQEPSR